MLIISYGITKSGSTLAFEMTRGVVKFCEQGKNPKSSPDRPKISAMLNEITAESIDELVRKAKSQGMLVVKTHIPFPPKLFSYISEKITANELRIQAAYRDPRDICLSLVDAGKKSRESGVKGLSALYTMDDAIRHCQKQIARFRLWGALPGALRLYYDTVAFNTDEAISLVEAQLSVVSDREAVKKYMFNEAFTQKNKATRDRYKDELTPQQNEKLAQVFEEYIDRACRMNDQSWFDAILPRVNVDLGDPQLPDSPEPLQRSKVSFSKSGLGSVLDCMIAHTKDGAFCVPRASSNRPVAQAILQGATTERQTIEWIKNNCGSGDVIHAGAYFGDFLPPLSRHCTGLVWAFEPNRENFRCAEITVRLNGLENICLHNAALSDELGSADFVVRFPDGRAMGGVSRFPRKNKIDPTRCETVKLTTIDSIVPMERTVSIIHLDVEGHESLALQGAINTIRRCRPALLLELLPSDPWFSENILGIGYRETEKLNGNTLLRI